MRDNSIEEVKSRCDIVDVIGREVELKRAGSNYKGLCPFHKEKTPSFVVSEDKQIFTCFGCGATGDVIEFEQKYYNLDFMEALEKLASECGVTIEHGRGGDTSDREELYRINREAAKFFYTAFRRAPNKGAEYMKGREIGEDILKKFGIGYADENWDSLYNYLKGLGFPDDKMLKLGLISFSKGKYYDKFRDRVMFPIINTGGKIIGFGGRAIGDVMPKYLNSQESSVFMKKNNLYGLNLTRQEISKENSAVIVEGYMDVIGLYQGGVRNVSASLGTALTDSQAKLIKRYTKNVILSYDADDAGRAAALRGIDILHGQGCRVRVLHVTDGKDPDEFIRKKGRQAFLDLTETALPYADYKFDAISRRHDMNDTEERLEFLKEAVGVLRTLSPVEADMYIRKLSSGYDISEGAIRKEMAETESGPPDRKRASREEHVDIPMGRLEKNIIKVLITESRFYERAGEFTAAFESTDGKAILKAMDRVYERGKEFDINLILDNLDESAAEAMKNIDCDMLPVGDGQKMFEDCLDAMKIEKLQKKEKLLTDKITMAEGMDDQVVKGLFEELSDTRSEISSLRKRGH